MDFTKLIQLIHPNNLTNITNVTLPNLTQFNDRTKYGGLDYAHSALKRFMEF